VNGVLEGTEAAVLLLKVGDEGSPLGEVDKICANIRSEHNSVVIGADDGQRFLLRELEMHNIAQLDVLGQIGFYALNHILNPGALKNDREIKEK